jgi:hippurate hydrolase
MKKLIVSIIVLLLPAMSVATSQPFDADAVKTQIEASIDRSAPNFDRIYKQLHAHPELAFQETKSAKLLADAMRKLGFDVTERVGTTGVVAIYRNGPGPVVMVRTEMDALPLEEKTGLPYASRARQVIEGKETFAAHACGHDVHMVWWIATAEVLVTMKERWRGTLMFIAQPAEETVSGAKAMLADGLFTRFPKPDYAFAAHVGGGTPLGTIYLKDGITFSASDSLDIIFNGRGAHGSAPSSAIDPIVMGAQFVSNVQSVISRQKDAGTFGVITVGSFHAGTVPNIIPDSAKLQLSLRSFSPEVRQLLLTGVERTANAVAISAGAPAPTITRVQGTAATRNDSGLVKELAQLMRPLYDEGLIVAPASAQGMSGSEDFSEFVETGVRSVYFMVGGEEPAKIADYKQNNQPMPINHSPQFAPSHMKAIRHGATVLALSVLMVTTPQPN